MKKANGDPDGWPDPAGPNSKRSVLAYDLLVEGDVTSSSPVDIQGRVVGSVHAPDVVVAGSGRLEGSIVAHDLTALGAVSGTIKARNVQLAPSSIVHADLNYERISIQEGAQFEGKLQHGG